MKKELTIITTIALLAVCFAGCLGGNPSPSPTPTAAATKNTTILLNNVTIVRGAAATINASLKSNGDVLNNQTIFWYIDSTRVRNSTTTNGTALLLLTANDTNQLSVGTHNLTAVFNRTSTYERSSATVLLVVSAPAPTATPTSPAPTSPAVTPTQVPTAVPTNTPVTPTSIPTATPPPSASVIISITPKNSST